jgi:hypothetical protein|tara:strand:- start:107 stop:601 length:495 start_codon:yes stop_codon:yes gene_type:complete
MAIAGQNGTPTILSAVLPNGQRQVAAGAHGTEDPNTDTACTSEMGGTSCWKTDIASYKKQFVGYQTIIQKFHGSAKYTTFEPIRYKSQVTNGVTYTIQYQTESGTVQATIYVPAVKYTNEDVTAVNNEPEVTQFVDEKGAVTGAYKLGASVMMFASLIASVMLA